MLGEDFWQDRQKAETTGRELNQLKEVLRQLEEFRLACEEVDVYSDLWTESGEEDRELAREAENALKRAEEIARDMELSTLFTSPYDASGCILTLHPGAGGTESQDWAEMLYRMYLRWCEAQGFQVEVLDYQSGDEAGLKSVTIGVSGLYAYGKLKAENGVHRLVRMSPFDSAGRRHTSFASVDVIPQVPDDVTVTIDETELRVDTYRSGGAGGQHVNKTDSAVRITHLPTGIVVQCQSERSQTSNKASAMKILTAKLYERKRREQEEKMNAIRGGKEEIAWGSQIRSYVFHPYKMVKDHRTGIEVGDVDRVMDGDIDPFISGWLHFVASGGGE